ncbi:MAG: cation-translocating P-type ATPase [Lentisphaeraceae bacterium]|nr:cation-translocating P-type ATPase [Lentisphaeraceae bacterium]
MLPNKVSESINTHEHTHDGDCCHGDDGHGHAHVPLLVTMLGGVLILNSFLAEWLYTGSKFQTQLSALLGALILGVPIIWAAIKDVAAGRFFMNELVALALLAAFIGEDYQTAGSVAFFMLIAIMIEHRTAIGAKTSIEQLIKLSPRQAKKIQSDGTEVEVDALELKVGDIVAVRPGEAFPIDGVVVKGITSVNQASITGESLPVDKAEEEEVYAGTQNLTGRVDIRVTRVGQDTTLGKVKNLIEQAENTKLPVMRMIDKYTGYYVPTVLMIAGLTYFFTQFNLDRVVAIFVISCPCALVIATPSAIVAAIASAARLGILVKDVSHLELASKIRALVFDKTGTLTEGNLIVSKMQPAKDIELAHLLKVAVTAESQSNHPAAKAMTRLAGEAKIKWEEPEKCEEVAGRGVVATIDGKTYRAGRKTWLEELKIDLSGVEGFNTDNAEGKSIVYVSEDDKVLGWIALSDAIRKEAKPMIQEFEHMGITNCNMVTGDNASVAKSVAAEIGIKNISSECLPQEKVDYVEKLKKEGYMVAVVGDGVNDAPALASGHIGIAMGAIGSDIAVNSASIALMNNDLRRIPFFLQLSKKTSTIMTQNLLIGLFSILGGLLLSTLGLLTGVNAAIIHTVSTLIIILNSARLVRQGEELEAKASAIE